MHLLFLCVCDEYEDLCKITGVASKIKKKIYGNKIKR